MCDWPVYGFHGGIEAARMCGKSPSFQVGPLGVCTQHWQILLSGIMDVARTQESVAEEIRWRLREAELGRRATELEARREMLYGPGGRPPYIYFAERDGFVKIGTTVNIAARMLALSGGGNMVAGMTVGPVTLLATTPGGPKEEKRLHFQFRRLRVDPRREWFRYEGALVRYVEGLTQPSPLAEDSI